MSDAPHFQIVHELEFDEELSRLIVDPERANDFIAGAEEVLARDPRAGLPASKTGKTWYLPMSPVDGRRVSIFYTFEEESVFLFSIQSYED